MTDQQRIERLVTVLEDCKLHLSVTSNKCHHAPLLERVTKALAEVSKPDA